MCAKAWRGFGLKIEYYEQQEGQQDGCYYTIYVVKSVSLGLTLLYRVENEVNVRFFLYIKQYNKNGTFIANVADKQMYINKGYSTFYLLKK